MVALDIETGVIPTKEASKNTLVFALGKAHGAKFSHALVEGDQGAPKLLKNGLRVYGPAGDVVTLVVRVDDAEFRSTVRPVELSIGRSLSACQQKM